jgi:hypothetical protein
MILLYGSRDEWEKGPTEHGLSCCAPQRWTTEVVQGTQHPAKYMSQRSKILHGTFVITSDHVRVEYTGDSGELMDTDPGWSS